MNCVLRGSGLLLWCHPDCLEQKGWRFETNHRWVQIASPCDEVRRCLREGSRGALLAPHQLGFGVPLGMEAAVHASHIFLYNLGPGHLILKFNFRNVFNCLRRDKMIAAVKQLAPELLPLVTCAYSTPSFLFFGEDIIPFSEGVQQGDPLDPLPFCLAIHNLVQQLQSELNVFFLDDGTLGGSLEEVLEDSNTVEQMAGS